MAYVDRVLGAGEEKLHVSHRHVIFLLARIALRALIAIVGIAIGIFLKTKIHNSSAGWIVLLIFLVVALFFVIQVVVLTFEWSNEQYVITGRRVIQTSGIIGKHMMDSSLNMINDLVLDQSIWGRMFNFGDIQIITGNEDENRLRGLQDPFSFKRALLAAKEQMALAYGAGHAPDVANAVANEDIPAQIAQLANLRDRGAISEAQFEAKRDELLRRL
jgi:uncharacterized membrane protein YdbT with pleckstrin-like domain